MARVGCAISLQYSVNPGADARLVVVVVVVFFNHYKTDLKRHVHTWWWREEVQE